MLTLAPNVIVVWKIAQEQAPDIAENYASVLSLDERRFAGQFRHQLDQTRYVLRRAAMRLILSDYLDKPPNDLVFQQNAYGKLSLANGPQFNVSRSNAVALLAISASRRVGIDVELIRPLPFIDQLAERIFTDAEQSQWKTMPVSARTPTFFSAWTRKEAVVKAIGKGLSLPLNRVAVPLASSRVVVDAELDGVPDWSVQSLAALDGYEAAIAAEGTGWAVEQHEFAFETTPRSR